MNLNNIDISLISVKSSLPELRCACQLKSAHVQESKISTRSRSQTLAHNENYVYAFWALPFIRIYFVTVKLGSYPTYKTDNKI